MSRPDVERLYTESFGVLNALALEDQRLTPGDAYDCLRALASRLELYAGPDDVDSFQAWAADVMTPSVWITGTVRECRPSVRFGIRKMLADADCDDIPELVNELESEVWAWLITNYDAMRKPGTASLRTRLFSRAMWTARARRKKERLRYSAVCRRMEREGSLGQIETLSDAELAELRHRDMEGVAA